MTGKSLKFKCEKCGKICKSKRGLTQHKCQNDNNDNKYKICPFCDDLQNTKNFKRHQMRCHKKLFFNLFSKFLNFLYKIIILYNNKNNIDNFLRFNEEKKYFIFQEKIKNKNENEIKKEEEEFKNENYISKNQDILKKIILEMKKEKEERKLNIFKDINLENNKKEIFDKLYDIYDISEKNELPGLSFRQLIFDFLKENDIKNPLIIIRINRKYKKKDFYTNDEIKKIDTNMAAKINNSMIVNSKYEVVYQKFYNMLKNFYEGKSKYKCIFCEKYNLHRFKHFKKCQKFKNLFNNENNEIIITKFLNYYYDSEKLSKIPDIYNNIIKKYSEKPFDYFINNINNNILYYNEFVKQENETKLKKIIKLKSIGKTITIRQEYLNKMCFLIKSKILIKYDIKINNVQRHFIEKEIKNSIIKYRKINEEEIINKFELTFKNSLKFYDKYEEEEEIVENKEEELSINKIILNSLNYKKEIKEKEEEKEKKEEIEEKKEEIKEKEEEKEKKEEIEEKKEEIKENKKEIENILSKINVERNMKYLYRKSIYELRKDLAKKKNKIKYIK